MGGKCRNQSSRRKAPTKVRRLSMRHQKENPRFLLRVSCGLTSKLRHSRRKPAWPAMMMFKFHVSVKTEGAAAVACSALLGGRLLLPPIFQLKQNKPTPETSAKMMVVLEKNHAQRQVLSGVSACPIKSLSVVRLMVTSFVGSACAHQGQP